MAEFFSRAVDWVRSLASGWDWTAVRDHPAWTALWKTAASPEGAALIATTFAVLGLGIVVGYLWARPRAVAAAPTEIPAAEPPAMALPPAPDTAPPPADAAPTALRSILRQRGLAPAAVDARIDAFRADLAAGRATLDELAAAADPADETDVMVAAATRALEWGDFEAAIDALDKAGARFGTAGRRMADAAEKRHLAAVRAATLAGDLEMAQFRFAAAAKLFARALALLPEGSDGLIATLLTRQATAIFQDGTVAEAETLLRRAVEVTERLRGAAHPEVAKALSRLAFVRYAAGQPAEAEALYRRALSIDETILGGDHQAVAGDLSNLAQLLLRGGNPAAAEPLLRRALAIRQAALAPGDVEVARSARAYADVLRRLKRPEDANRVLADAALARRQTAEGSGPSLPTLTP
ncbi:tetratricopeptide repeat protein [Shumkonia mesophila]|uniref:tetratricopeptide repeat protein n=1 Tax=Shumkonia mesophila TaxID=2838854 RepID=UPI0029345127|nr:tetratricopeptide repeat protein [Shumkonia mesophila]